jgi:hypothetical protein
MICNTLKMKIMKRNNRVIFQWAVWLCIALAACSGIEDEPSIVSKVNGNSSDTRAELIEYTIHVKTAGSLYSLVNSGSYADAQKLVITGNIGYKDVNYVDEYMTTVEVLDLSGAVYENESINGTFLSESTKIKEISLPGNITSISGYWWYNNSLSWGRVCPFMCTSLTRITLPDGLITIGGMAFYECSSLTNINIPNSVTSIGSHAFYGCRSLTNINLPESVTFIGNSAFCICSSLTQITLPKDITSIGNMTFGWCPLTSIDIPQGVTSIGSSAFYFCESLTSINIPEGVTDIGVDAFCECSSLKYINIPKSVTSIGNEALAGCPSLKIVKWDSSCPLTSVSYTYNKSTVFFVYTDENGALPTDYDKFGQYAIDDVFDELDMTYLDEEHAPYLTKAKKLIYTKEFPSYSYNAWTTISLPFSPTHITHEQKGVVAPFNSEVEDAKHFWLRELTQDGYQNKTEIEANHAYIIAMPTSDGYSPEFRLDGTVTFSAENVDLSKLTWEPIASEGTTYTMYPNFGTVKRSGDIYVLNTDYWIDGYDYGHVFMRSVYDVNPYETYVKLNDGAATMRSVIPMADGKRTAVRGVSSSGDAGSRGAYGQSKPQIDDM